MLVTGGAGFVGSHLIDKLAANGSEITVLDSFTTGRLENIKHHLDTGRCNLVKGDVTDKSLVERVLKDVDVVVHLAALISVEESLKHPFEVFDVNVAGTLNLLERAVNGGVKRFVYASSTAVYGEENPLPLKEDYPPKPISPYAASKASAESYCNAFHSSYGLETVILRFFNIYGPRQEKNPYSGVITKFVRNCLENKPLTIYGDGGQTRDFIYVADVVEATTLAIEDRNAIGETFNVCTGKPVEINELALTVKDLLGKKKLNVVHSPLRKGDIRSNYGNPSKARRLLGFRANVDLREGIAQLLK